MKTEFAWDWSSLSQAKKVRGAPCLTGKDMIRESIRKMKNGKFAGSSSVV